MDARFKISTDELLISPVCEFTYSWGLNCGLSDVDAMRFTVSVSELITNIFLFAYPNDSQAFFDVTFKHSSSEVELIVTEVGEPFDPDRHLYSPHNALSNGDFEGAGFRLIEEFCDEFVFINKGKEGKEYRLTKNIKLVAHPIDELLEYPVLGPAAEKGIKTKPAKKVDFSVKQIATSDAEDISKLIYRTYNYTYTKGDMYFPKKIERAVLGKEKLGVIARCSTSGEAIGYFAILKKENSNIAEIGEAVVSPDFRRQGVMSGMIQALIKMARKLNLAALFGKAVTLHTVSQQVNAKFGYKSTALMLAETRSAAYKGFDEEYPQPVSVVIDFLPLNISEPKLVYLPDKYTNILLQTYKLLEINVKQGEPTNDHLAKKSDIDLDIDYSRSTAQLVVHKYGKDFKSVFNEILQSLENRKMNAIYVDLPLENGSTPKLFSEVKNFGFIYCGLVPQFYGESDFLRLQKVYAELNLDLIEVYSGFGKKIKSLIDEEYYRNA